MQLHDTANGPELEMNSALAYPSWTTSTKPCPCNVVPNGKHNHWCPPDAFHCTFCPRVFRTAQALGGHMNIHRRQRACANENGACYHTHPEDSQPINSMLFRPSSSLPAPLVGPHGSSLFFGGNSQQLPIDLSQSSPSVRHFVENCYANRNIATTPDAQRQANFFAPAAGDMTNHRVGRNRGDGATSTDPLSWLFSQLPPPGSITALQRQQQLQQQQHQHQQYRATNGLFQNNLVARPYAPRPSAPYADDTPLARVRPRPVVVAMGGRHGQQDGATEGLDLELRL